jgi:hypothetical protein
VSRGAEMEILLDSPQQGDISNDSYSSQEVLQDIVISELD